MKLCGKLEKSHNILGLAAVKIKTNRIVKNSAKKFFLKSKQWISVGVGQSVGLVSTGVVHIKISISVIKLIEMLSF